MSKLNQKNYDRIFRGPIIRDGQGGYIRWVDYNGLVGNSGWHSSTKEAYDQQQKEK